MRHVPNEIVSLNRIYESVNCLIVSETRVCVCMKESREVEMNVILFRRNATPLQRNAKALQVGLVLATTVASSVDQKFPSVLDVSQEASQISSVSRRERVR